MQFAVEANTRRFGGGYIAPNEKRSWKSVLRQTQTGLVDFEVFAAEDWTLSRVKE